MITEMPKRSRSVTINDAFLGPLFLQLRIFLKVREVSNLSACCVQWERYLCSKKEWPMTHQSNPKFSAITSMHVARTRKEYEMLERSGIVYSLPPNLTSLTLGHCVTGTFYIPDDALPHTL